MLLPGHQRRAGQISDRFPGKGEADRLRIDTLALEVIDQNDVERGEDEILQRHETGDRAQDRVLPQHARPDRRAGDQRTGREPAAALPVRRKPGQERGRHGGAVARQDGHEGVRMAPCEQHTGRGRAGQHGDVDPDLVLAQRLPELLVGHDRAQGEPPHGHPDRARHTQDDGRREKSADVDPVQQHGREYACGRRRSQRFRNQQETPSAHMVGQSARGNSENDRDRRLGGGEQPGEKR
nr:hypothetical protein [Streptomyces purpureus]